MNDHQSYELKPSRLALGFQFLSMIFMTMLLSLLLNVWLCILLFIVALISLMLMRSQSKVQCLEYLDQEDWTLKYVGSSAIQHVKIKQMFDHSFYIVIHKKKKKTKNLIIWCDQLSKKQLKSLKTRSKLL